MEVLQQRGKKHSAILREQQESFGGSSQGGGLRYSNSIIFWLKCDQVISKSLIIILFFPIQLV